MKATEEAWDAKGVAFTAESPGGHRRLRVTPAINSPLGALSRTLKRRFDEALIFDPTVLYKERAKGSHHLVTREVFLSIGAAQSGDVTQTERHEMLHVFFQHRYQVQGLPTVFNGWAHPRGAGVTLFGDGANYTKGFSFEEQAASAFDAAAELRGHRAVVEGMQVPGADHAAGVKALSAMAARLRLHLDQFAGPSLAAKSLDIASMLDGVAPVLDASALSQLVARPSLFFGRDGLSTSLASPTSTTDTIDVEFVLKELPKANKTVVEVRIQAEGLDVNLPLFDPALVEPVRKAIAGDPLDAAALAKALAPALQAQASAISQVGQTQVQAWETLATQVDALDAALALAGPAPADPQNLLAAVKGVRRAAAALRHTILAAVA